MTVEKMRQKGCKLTNNGCLEGNEALALLKHAQQSKMTKFIYIAMGCAILRAFALASKDSILKASEIIFGQNIRSIQEKES
jgi:hypothetical protein